MVTGNSLLAWPVSDFQNLAFSESNPTDFNGSSYMRKAIGFGPIRKYSKYFLNTIVK